VSLGACWVRGLRIIPQIAREVRSSRLLISGRWADHDSMPPDLVCYEERYWLTGGAALGLAASLLSIALGVVWHTAALFAVIAVVLAALTVALPGGGVIERGPPPGRVRRRPRGYHLGRGARQAVRLRPGGVHSVG
jgi:hypothetical protein